VAPPRLDLGAALFVGRLDPYGLDPFGYRSLWLPPDWTCGSHFSVAAWIPMALMLMTWIPMAALRLALGDALFGDRSALGGLDLYGFPPTGLAGRTFRWPLGSPWLGSLWLRSPTGPGIPMAWILMAWIPMASPRLATHINCAA